MNFPKEKELHKLLYFMEERQLIYLRRKTGRMSWPWTDDPILQKYKFCNIYREQDTVTKWIDANWRKPYKDHVNLWFAMCIARQLNWPPALEAIGFPEKWDPNRVLRILQERAQNGEKNYSSAYMITAGGHPGEDKPTITVAHALDPLYKAEQKLKPLWEFTDSLQNTWNWFIRNKFYGWGPFLAYEVVTDLRHTRYLRNAKDINTWANPGPGCKRGLNRLYKEELNKPASDKEFLDKMRFILKWLLDHRDEKILPTLEMRDIEHTLCEWDKRCRAIDSEIKGTRCGLELYKPPVAKLF